MLWGSLVLAAVSLAGGPARAETVPKLQPVPIAVIDFRAVLSQSDAAKGIREVVDGRRAQYRDKFSKIEQQLRDDQQALAQQRSIITKDAFEQRARELKERARQAQLEAQASNQQITQAFDVAMDKVQKELFRVVADVAEESGASVVLFRSAIVIAVKTLEISHVALERLNKNLPKVEVVFEPTKN